MTTSTTTDNRDTTAVERIQSNLTRFSDGFLARVAASNSRRAHQCRWEMDRRAHQTQREHKLSPAYRNPVPAHLIQAGDVISEGRAMRALVREAYRLPLGRVLLGVSWLNLVTGEPEEQVHELPLLDPANTGLHLVTHVLSDVAPYAVPLAVS